MPHDVSGLCIYYFHLPRQFSIFLLARTYPFSKTRLMHTFLWKTFWKSKRPIFCSCTPQVFRQKHANLFVFVSAFWYVTESDTEPCATGDPQHLPTATQHLFALSSFLTESPFTLVPTPPQVVPHLRKLTTPPDQGAPGWSKDNSFPSTMIGSRMSSDPVWPMR